MKNISGLTLIELMVVVAVLAIISAIAVPAYRGYIQTGLQSECQNEMAAIALAEEEFFLQNNTYVAGNMNFGTSVTLIAALNNLYIPSTQANSANTNCSYAVVAGATTYTITATGRNKLPGSVVLTKTK